MGAGGVRVVPEPQEGKSKVKHPAVWSDAILAKLDVVVGNGVWLDPFAGTAKIMKLETPSRRFVCVELEPEWAASHPDTIQGDSLVVMEDWIRTGTMFDGVVTSPVYGNRMSDHHNAKDGSRRRGYKFDLGRDVSEGSSGAMYFWQDEYKEFHRRAWELAYQVTTPGGEMYLNVSDFIRTVRRRVKVAGAGDSRTTNKVQQRVVAWHMKALIEVGWRVVECLKVATPRMRDGANGKARAEHENIIVAKKPGGEQ